MDNILTRRSIRKYRSKPVSDEQIESILKAAMSAPSAANKQPWDFIVLKDKQMLTKISEFHPYAKMATEVSAAIIVCGDTRRSDERGFWVQDCAAASQNILLAANSLGLGSVWCGVYPKEDLTEKFKELLNLPEEVFPVSFIPIGFPAEEKPPSERFDQKKIHQNNW